MVNTTAAARPEQLRISFDAKIPVKICNLSTGGNNRLDTRAGDRDFGITETSTPVGIYSPTEKDLFLYMVRSKVTSDCGVDIIEQWWDSSPVDREKIKRLVVNLDNGPEQSSQRTQFTFRIQQFADKKNR